MNADPSQVELRLPKDQRLIAAVDAVVAHASERAGLSQEEQTELSRATAEACDETFSLAARNGKPNPIVRVVISDYPNRVEVSIEESAEARGGRGQERVATPAEKLDPVNAALEQMEIDRVHHEVREGRPCTILVKHHAGAKTTYEH
jgi:anti-sigma regulatory factor (Ser/Thr protein kinase)